MKQLLLLNLVALLFVSCATKTKQTDALVKNHQGISSSSMIQGVPLVKQKRNHCGPAAMSMVMQHAGKNVALDELTSQLFTKDMEGTFQIDMVSTARRQGMLAIPITDLNSLLKEVSAGHPVIVFQNLGFTWAPTWHFAVVTGHDLSGPDVYLHTGGEKYKKTDMRFFERSWVLGEHWGLLVLRPDQLSVTADEKAHVDAASRLEALGKMHEAQQVYQNVFRRWPQSLGALIGLGNVTYAAGDYKKSVDYLETAVQRHSSSAIAWHNLATAQGAAGHLNGAHRSSKRAMQLVEKEERATYEKSLAAWLK